MENEVLALLHRLDEKIDRLDRKVDGLDQRLGAHDQRFADLERNIGGHDQKFESLDRKLSGHDQKFESLDRKLDALSAEVKLARTETRQVETNLRAYIGEQVKGLHHKIAEHFEVFGLQLDERYVRKN